MGTTVYCTSCAWSGDEGKTRCVFDSILQDYIQVCPICREDIIEDKLLDGEEYGCEYIEEEDY